MLRQFARDPVRQHIAESCITITEVADSLVREEGISFRQALMLLDMQQQIIAHRSSIKKENLDKVDWQKFYEAVKDFLK